MSKYQMIKSDFLDVMTSREDRIEFCPPKTCMSLESEEGIVTETFTVMPAKDRHGNFGTKDIYVNDETCEYVEHYILNNHEVDYDGITIERCALMNKLTLEFADMLDYSKIGYIGNGRINIATNKLLNPKSCVIHGAPTREDKNKDKFERCEVDTDFSKLNDCDVVFVCTNSYKEENLISTEQLNANLIIALDCGYTLDESFRKEYVSFSDHPEQLFSAYEHEFPFDEEKHRFFDLTKLRVYILTGRKCCVYLHGIGLADLSIAKEMYPEYVRS